MRILIIEDEHYAAKRLTGLIKKEMEEAIIDLGFRINIHAEFEDEKAQLLWNEIVESFKDWIDEQKARIQNR
mgnify:CR=1 FL=1